MANTTTVVIQEDGPRNTVVTFLGTIDTPPLTTTVVLDPLAQFIDTGSPTTQYRVDTIDYVISDSLEIQLQWDATTPVQFLNLYGRGNWSIGKTEGGLKNTSGAGKTGKITAISNTPAAGTYFFTIQMLCVKQ
jgi:hypothetical protein